MDPELLSVMATAGLETHVVTRNPHRNSIEQFLLARGVRATVHCVHGGGRAAKAEVVRSLVAARMDLTPLLPHQVMAATNPSAMHAVPSEASPAGRYLVGVPNAPPTDSLSVTSPHGCSAQMASNSDSASSVIGLFVDDDINEHAAMGEVAPGLHIVRVIFART